MPIGLPLSQPSSPPPELEFGEEPQRNLSHYNMDIARYLGLQSDSQQCPMDEMADMVRHAAQRDRMLEMSRQMRHNPSYQTEDTIFADQSEVEVQEMEGLRARDQRHSLHDDQIRPAQLVLGVNLEPIEDEQTFWHNDERFEFDDIVWVQRSNRGESQGSNH